MRRIAYPMRADLFDNPGGDLVQIRKYIEFGGRLNRSGVPPFTGEIITNLNEDLARFDVVHLTNIDRPAEAYHYFKRAQISRRPIVISTIHHSYPEIRRFERAGRGGAIGRVSRWLGFTQLEYLRNAVRSVAHPELLPPTLKLLAPGMRNAQLAILRGARRVLVLTDKERRDLASDIGPLPSQSCLRLTNGIDHSPPSPEQDPKDLDVCIVGRIESRKNQLAILRALNQLHISGVFIGKENPRHQPYCAEFRNAILSSRSAYLGALSHDDTMRAMRRAKVHVSASWFEVLSLVDIEAYRAGCAIVASQCGGTRELLGSHAEYVDPASQLSIRQAIERAYNKSLRGGSNHPLKIETWDAVAAQLAEVYSEAASPRG